MDKKVAIITGGSRGVGADLAKLCAEKGWNMTITCSNSIDDAKNVAKECEKLDLKSLYYKQMFLQIKIVRKQFLKQ